MKRLSRLALLVLFAVIVVSGANWLASKPIETEQQGEAATEIPAVGSVEQETSEAVNRLVQLYPAGTLTVERPREKSPAADSNTPDGSETRQANVRGKGQRPVLEVSYDRIGFERYLDVIGSVGRFFLLLRDATGSATLGPEVSFQLGILVPRNDGDLDALAVRRPHLVSDARIVARLATLRLPENALDDRVVLMLTKPFDAELWGVVTRAATKLGLGLEEITLIRGAYVEGVRGVFLRLDEAITRSGEREIAFGQSLRINL